MNVNCSSFVLDSIACTTHSISSRDKRHKVVTSIYPFYIISICVLSYCHLEVKYVNLYMYIVCFFSPVPSDTDPVLLLAD